MYGVVLMAAVTAGQATPQWGCKSCKVNYGACYGACYGYGYTGWAEPHPPAGCWGLPYGGYGPGWAGYACFGGCGGYASPAFGVPAPVIANPAPDIAPLPEPKGADEPKGKTTPKAKPKDDDDDQARAADRARLIVRLPEGAKLYVDDQPVAAAGQKAFRTPQLVGGQRYYYELRAEVVRDGRVVRQTRRVTLGAGDVIRADFSGLGEPAVAANGR